jgi:hypothetical protein
LAWQPGQFALSRHSHAVTLQQSRTIGLLLLLLLLLQAFKPDMQACSQLKEQMGSDIRSGVFGHVPGVAVGQQFLGRGQLAILGLHSQMMKGIDCK